MPLAGSLASFTMSPNPAIACGLDRVAQIAKDLGISESGLRRWMAQADVDEGKREGLTTAEKEELTRLRRENRVLRMERDLLSRAAAFFAQENVLPK